MEHSQILTELLIILLVTAPVVFICQKIKLPAMIGFLVAGIILGPSLTNWISNKEDIEIFAEIGVVLLLFSIGLQFSFSNLKQLRKQMLIGGSLQVLLTAGSVFVVTHYFGWGLKEALVIGFLIALSSTAIVFKLLWDRGEIRAPHGMFATAILLFQDLCVVPMVLVVQAMGGEADVSVMAAAWNIVRALAILIGLWFLLRLLLVPIFAEISRLQNRELFLIFTVLLVIGVAWLTDWLGLSYALGAFIVGILLAESDYSHEVMAEITPIRNLLFSLFFISIGMLLDLSFVLENWQGVAGFTLTAIVGKALIIGVIVLVMTRSIRLSVLVAMLLAQVGEFSFVLAQLAREYDILSNVDYQGFLATTLLTMLLTPLSIKVAPKVAMWFGQHQKETLSFDPKTTAEKKGHTIILGFGVTGHNLGRVLTETHTPFVIVELLPDLIREAKDMNYDVIFGDVSKRDILLRAGVETARVLVIAISDPLATRHALSMARTLNKNITIIVRSRQEVNFDQYYKFGANQVISEEFETSVEIFSRVLEEYHIPRNITQMQVELVRQDRYSMLRGLSLSPETMANLPDVLAKTVVETYVLLDGSPWLGKTVGELNLKETTGTFIISVVRNVASTANPSKEMVLEQGDVLIIVGSHVQLDAAIQRLEGKTD